jgi:hypothetical protein
MQAKKIRVVECVLAALAAFGCGSIDDRSLSVGEAGSVSARVVLGQVATLNSVTYSVTGPSSYSNSITVDTTTTLDSQRRIDGLVPGTYHVVASGSTAEGYNCTGAADFDVVARRVSQVVVHLVCTFVSNSGSATLGSSANICAAIKSLNVTPNAAGTQFALAATALDPDNGPNPVSFSWLVNTTQLSGSTATFNCPAAGTFPVILTVSDGDSACPASAAAGTQDSATFTCLGPF